MTRRRENDSESVIEPAKFLRRGDAALSFWIGCMRPHNTTDNHSNYVLGTTSVEESNCLKCRIFTVIVVK